jgi:glycosyltransferase involved in cell wall biosynthesis
MIIASLTTIPSRIDKIQVCLQSLLDQTIPVKVQINVPYKCVRTNEDYVIPEWLEKMNVEIFRTEDYGAITKVAPTFLRCKDEFIWSVDDDWKYPPNSLETLFKEHDPKNPRILAHSGVSYDSNFNIEYLNGGSKNVPIAEGYTSILYPPQIWKSDFKEYLDKVSENSDCRKSDDLVLGNYFAKIGVTTFLTEYTTKKRLFSFLDKDLIQPYENDKDCLHLQDQGHALRYIKVMNWLKEKNIYYLPFQLKGDIKLGLCMIVKNESHIIHEVLECTKDLIDTWCIVDTGSTDNTIQIIKNFYDIHNIEGKLYECEWKGFGPSRSEALKLCDGQMDYILMIDADDLISYPGEKTFKGFLKNILKQHIPNALNINIKRGNIDYQRTQLFKANDGWRYVGVLHEYPTNDKPNNRFVNLPSEFYMIGRTMGSRSMQEGNKYLRDAETLLAEVLRDPENDRNVFYLAQSYRDGGNLFEAIKWYKKRYEMGRWKEEQCVCAMNLSRLLFENLEESKEWAWKAHECSPERSESLISFAGYCRSKSIFSQELFSMILYASSIPKPKQQVLFVESDMYEWKVWDELCIIACFTGHLEIAKKACVRLLHEEKFPPEEKSRIELNLKSILNGEKKN